MMFKKVPVAFSQAPEAETAALKLAEERLDEVSTGAQTLLKVVAYIDGTGFSLRRVYDIMGKPTAELGDVCHHTE